MSGREPDLAAAGGRATPSPGALAPRPLERYAWPLLAAAAAVAAALALYFGRGLSLSVDELIWFTVAPEFDLGEALEPHNGHLVLVTRLVYEGIFGLQGPDYLPFRLLTLAALLVTCVLFFVYASRRIGKTAALAPTLVLLVFGSDADHVLAGNGFTVLTALACGLGALLCLEREDLRGDVGACLLLLLGVATYTVALPFVVAAAVLVLVRDRRPSRLWIPAVPTALYAVWWLASTGDGVRDPDSQVHLENILLAPAWAFQSLGVALGSLTGLDYEWAGSTTSKVGPVLALIAIVAIVWQARTGRVAPTGWAPLAALVVLWTLGALATAPLIRPPSASRYMFPASLTVLLVGAAFAANVRWTRPALIALFTVAAVGIATNVSLLRERGAEMRAGASQIRSHLGALELAGENANPELDLGEAVGEDALVAFSLDVLADEGIHPVEAYLTAADDYGGVGFDAAELEGQPEQARAGADTMLVRALGLALAPADGQPDRGCEALAAGTPTSSLELPPGGEATLVADDGQPAEVQLRRFADQTSVPVGTAMPGQPAALELPPDDAPTPWTLTIASGSAQVCPR